MRKKSNFPKKSLGQIIDLNANQQEKTLQFSEVITKDEKSLRYLLRLLDMQVYNDLIVGNYRYVTITSMSQSFYQWKLGINDGSMYCLNITDYPNKLINFKLTYLKFE